MKLSIKGLAFAGALLWAGAISFVGIGHAIHPSYGRVFLDCVVSIYPGLGRTAGITRLVASTLYGLIDGAAGAALFGWIYNSCSTL